MDVKLIAIVVLFGFFSCSEPVEKMDNNASPQHQSGIKFYQQRCDVCHGADGKLGASDAKDLSKSSITEEQIKNIINRGQGAMPPFEHAIESDSTLIELVDHVKSLRK